MQYQPYLPKIKEKKNKKLGKLLDLAGKLYLGASILDHLGNFFKGRKITKDSEPLLFVPDKPEEDKSKDIFNRYTSPSDKDYKKGNMKRYFVKDIPSNKVSELDKKSYLIQKKENKPYRKFYTIDWLVKGIIDDTEISGYSVEGIKSKNEKAIQSAEKALPGISNVLSNSSQFAKNNDLLSDEDKLGANTINNLQSKKGQYVIAGTNVSYNGPYHIHPKQGPMVGAKHTAAQHPKLSFIGTEENRPKELINQQNYVNSGSTVSQNKEYDGYTLIRSE